MDVFLADDEVMARILLKDLLDEQKSRFDINVAGEAENGEDLLRLLEETRPDLVFVDIRMPLCDGLEVIRIANKRYEGIPWVIVSGFSEFAYAREAVRLGVIDYLVKPVEPEDLVRVLEKAEEALAVRVDEENARWEQASLEHVSTDPEFENFGDAICAKDVRPASRGRNTADRILEYVERHFREDIGVNTVADRFDLTPSYVSSLFKKKTGSTFVRYLAERRIREAKELILNQSDLPLREVSVRSGFNNPRYFSKLFLRYAGMLPSEFRREG